MGASCTNTCAGDEDHIGDACEYQADGECMWADQCEHGQQYDNECDGSQAVKCCVVSGALPACTIAAVHHASCLGMAMPVRVGVQRPMPFVCTSMFACERITMIFAVAAFAGDGSYIGAACDDHTSGSCRWSDDCSGGQQFDDECDGSAAVKCCVPDRHFIGDLCEEHPGTCQYADDCEGGMQYTGECGGSADVKCCVSTGVLSSTSVQVTCGPSG